MDQAGTPGNPETDARALIERKFEEFFNKKEEWLRGVVQGYVDSRLLMVEKQVSERMTSFIKKQVAEAGSVIDQNARNFIEATAYSAARSATMESFRDFLEGASARLAGIDRDSFFALMDELESRLGYGINVKLTQADLIDQIRKAADRLAPYSENED